MRGAERPDVALRRDLLRLFARAPWDGNIQRWSAEQSVLPRTGAELVIAIPARDESARIEGCLSACAWSSARSGLPISFLVLVNGSSDDTAARVRRWSKRAINPVTIVEADFAPALAHAGAARRLALEIAALGKGADTILMTTDADARPMPGWVGANVRHLRAGVDLVCGQILPIPIEAARLPSRLDDFGRLEAAYRRAMLELEHLVDPDPWNPWPHHGGASGASLALRVREWEAIGGVQLVPCGEDRALAARMRAHGRVVVHADDVAVEVSCRTHGRAAGGMADTIRYRMADPDPWCDETIEPARAVRDRLVRRATLRAAWPSFTRRVDLLERFGADGTLARRLAGVSAFEAVWGQYASEVLDSRRTRLRFGELPDELVRLQALLVRERAATSAALPLPGALGARSPAERTS